MVTNSILWGNSGQQIVYEPPAEPPTVEYCNVQGGWSGTGNINLDPLFVTLGQPGDWFYGKYYLSQTATGDPNQTQDSPCPNAGNDTAENVGLWSYSTRTDFVGDGYDTIVDMGYHYSRDCNDNDIPDAQELADGTQEDCNYNGVPDECDILISHGGLCDPSLSLCSSDVEPQMGDGIPDECGEEPNPAAFTVNADFEFGTLINVHHDDPTGDQLQRYEFSRPLPYLWVAASGRGSVVRIYTGDDPTIGQLGDVLGEYLTAPGTTASNPSRTTVDLDGNAWVANRNDDHYDPQTQQWTGSVTRFGLLIGGTRCEITGRPNPAGECVKPPFRYNTCVDRNRDGLIRTFPPTTPLPEPLPWYEPRYESVGTVFDEATLNYVRVDATGTRHVSVDANNDVWVSGSGGVNSYVFNLVDGVTGEIKPDKTFNKGFGGYGGLIDCAGVIWSARDDLFRYETDTSNWSVGFCANSYGVGIDREGNIWSTNYDSHRVCKLFASGGSYAGLTCPQFMYQSL